MATKKVRDLRTQAAPEAWRMPARTRMRQRPCGLGVQHASASPMHPPAAAPLGLAPVRRPIPTPELRSASPVRTRTPTPPGAHAKMHALVALAPVPHRLPAAVAGAPRGSRRCRRSPKPKPNSPCLGEPHPWGQLPRTKRKDVSALQRWRRTPACALARQWANSKYVPIEERVIPSPALPRPRGACPRGGAGTPKIGAHGPGGPPVTTHTGFGAGDAAAESHAANCGQPGPPGLNSHGEAAVICNGIPLSRLCAHVPAQG